MASHIILNALKRAFEYIRTMYYTLTARVHFKLYQIKINGSISIRGPLNLYVHHKGKFEFGSNCRINSGPHRNPVGSSIRMTFWVGRGGRLTIGNQVAISNSTIVCMDHISIEDGVFIGGDCKIYDTDFHPLDMEVRLKNLSRPKTAPILIKRGSFIGGHTIILKGVTIGKGSVIGAGSIVTKDIPDFEIWAGNPAQFVRKLDE